MQLYNQIFMFIYVYDILITGNNQTLLTNILDQLNVKFFIKHLGESHLYLGIQISYQTHQYFLSQTPYATSVLQMAILTQCNPLSNPTCTKLPTNIPGNSSLYDPTLYHKITSSL